MITNDDHITFRDKLANVDDEGKQKRIYPKKPSGRFTNYRTALSAALLVFFFAAPFIKINGYPLILINILERKFIIFGKIFWPQDMYILVLMLLAAVVFVIVFTVAFGRLFCGWACPQTIFLEMVFRKIEYWIDGDYTKQKALAKAGWTTEKIWKRTLKHSIFFAFSVITANLFLSYIIGYEAVIKIATEPLRQHLSGFAALLVFSGAFYGVFAHFRENVCIVACPYGRLQGVLLDKNSMVITYDYKRGEPRGKLRKDEERSIGDCIDCKQCVHVCPTGIDIRNGIQLECVNCTACIDACDDIMDKIKKPRGLIRYDSLEGIETGKAPRLNARQVAYSVVLVALLALVTTLLVTRTMVDGTILRAQGTLYQKTAQGISNLYNVKIINKSYEKVPISLKLISPQQGTINIVGDQQNLLVPAEGLAEGSFFLDLPKTSISGMTTKVEIGLYEGDKLIKTIKTKFLSPTI